MREPFGYKFSGFLLDTEKLRLIYAGEELPLSPKGAAILLLLIRERGRIVSRQEIMEKVWGDVFVEEGNINFQISTLRKVLGNTLRDSEHCIRTIPKQGYKFVAVVEELAVHEKNYREATMVDNLDTAESHTKKRTDLRRYSVIATGIAIILLISGVFTWQSLTFAENMTASVTNRSITLGRSTLNDEALANYERGMQIWEGRVYSDQAPIELFSRAIELDPKFAAAHLAMADVYATMGKPLAAESSLERVRQLDPDFPGIYASEGFIKRFLYWDKEGAMTAFSKGIEKHPSDVKTRHWYGVMLSLDGNIAGARQEMQTALLYKPTSLIIMSDLAQLSYFAGDYTRAAAELEAVFRIDPHFSMARRYSYYIEIFRGNEQNAIDAFLNARVLKSDQTSEILQIYGEQKLAGVQKKINLDNKCDEPGDIVGAIAYNCTINHLLLGENEAALTAFSRAVNEKGFMTPFAAIDPIFDPIRNTPRFQDLIAKTGYKAK
ncbi:MAG: winged helix-turn-helix domain-containing protein [Acidobacteria bacterium]|nr:winged helix-turn-helix domain-containing protein [Acidobacteriota bacterium]